MPDKVTLKIPVIAEAMTWMVVLANVRIALKHPGNAGELHDVASQFCVQLEEKLLEEGVYSPEEIAKLRRAAKLGLI